MKHKQIVLTTLHLHDECIKLESGRIRLSEILFWDSHNSFSEIWLKTLRTKFRKDKRRTEQPVPALK